MKKYLYSCCLVLLLFSSCNSIVYEDNKIIDNNSWLFKDPFTTEFDIQDTSVLYDIYFKIKHSDDYPNENIYLRITDDFSGELNIDTVNIDLSDEYGVWKGNDSYKNFDYKALLHKNFKFKDPKIYIVKFEQFTRNDTLKGVNEIGFELSRSKKQ